MIKGEEKSDRLKNSIYYNLKEFHDLNPSLLYINQDFKKVGSMEFKVVTEKNNKIKKYEKIRFSNELIDIIKNISYNKKTKPLQNYLNKNPIINYYDVFVKIFKDFIDNDKKIYSLIKSLVDNIIKESSCSEEIKLALIIAPLCKLNDLKDILEVFSIHNDYIFYVIEGYKYIENSNNIIFELAKRSKGYGKFFSVINVSPITYEIRKWIIECGSIDDIVGKDLTKYSILSINLMDYLENTEFNYNNLELFSKSFSMMLCDYSLNEISNPQKVCNKVLEIIDNCHAGIYSLYSVISILYSIEEIILDEVNNNKNNHKIYDDMNNKYEDIIAKANEICLKERWKEIIASELSDIRIEVSVLISSIEKTKYKIKKNEFALLLKRENNNPLIYKYAFVNGNKTIKKCAFNLGLKNLPISQVICGQDKLTIENLSYDDINQICFFIIIKYSKYEDFKEEYKEINFKALKSPLIETRIQAIENIKQFKEELSIFQKEIINDAISTEMVTEIKRSLNSLLIPSKSGYKKKKYIKINEEMYIESHVKDVYLTNLNILGMENVDVSEICNKLTEYDIVYLKEETYKEYNNNVIEVITKEGFVLGYLIQEDTKILKNLIKRGKYLYGRVKTISENYTSINIDIYLSYKDVIEGISDTLSLLAKEREEYLQ